MLEGKRVIAIRDNARRGRAIKAIARDFGVSRNTVRRYLRQGLIPGAQARPAARRLSDDLRRALGERVGDSRRWRARATQRWLAEHGATVSVRTLRRAVGLLRRDRRDHAGRGGQLEMDLVREVARRWRTADRDELESALTLHLAKLLDRRQAVRNWRAFLVKALRRRASNWVRDRMLEATRLTSLDRTIPAKPGIDVEAAPMSQPDVAPDDRIAVERMRALLDRSDRHVLDVLVAEDFNLTRAADRLGVHRNTMPRLLRRLRRELERRGFRDPDCAT